MWQIEWWFVLSFLLFFSHHMPTLRAYLRFGGLVRIRLLEPEWNCSCPHLIAIASIRSHLTDFGYIWLQSIAFPYFFAFDWIRVQSIEIDYICLHLHAIDWNPMQSIAIAPNRPHSITFATFDCIQGCCNLGIKNPENKRYSICIEARHQWRSLRRKVSSLYDLCFSTLGITT